MNEKLYIIVSKFIHSLDLTITKDEFYEVKTLINTGKIQAIKHLREITAQKEEALFKLDLTQRCNGSINSTISYWAITQNIDLRTGEVKKHFLGLKEAEDIVDFIALNM